MANVAVAAREAQSTFENNQKVTYEGKDYGWAMKNGQKVLVEWGTVLGETTEAAKKATEALSDVEAPTVENGITGDIDIDLSRVGVDASQYKSNKAQIDKELEEMRKGRAKATSTVGEVKIKDPAKEAD